VGLSFASLIFPFNPKEKYSLAAFVDLTALADSGHPYFRLKNKKNRGKFFLEDELLSRKDLKKISVSDVENIFYKPLFPSGSRGLSSLPVDNVNGGLDKIDPFGENSKKIFNDDLVDNVKFISFKGKDRNSTSSKFITRRDWLPDVTGESIDFLAYRAGDSVALSELIRLYDPDGQKVKSVLLSDLDTGDLGGYLRYKGVDYNGQSLGKIKAKNFRKVKYVIGEPGSANRISISAGSKSGFGDEQIFSFDTLSNIKPSVLVDDNEFARQSIGEIIDLSRLINVVDPEGKNLSVEIKVDSDSAFPGVLVVGDRPISVGESYQTTLDDMSDLGYRVGRPGSVSDIKIVVLDDEYLVEKNVEWKTISNSAPETSLDNVSFLSSTAGQEQPVAGYFDYSDPDGDRIRDIGFIAQGGGGYFVRKGNQYRDKIVYFPLEELPEVKYVPGPQDSKTTVGISVRDEWGDQKTEFADWVVLSEESTNTQFALDLYNRIGIADALPPFDIIMKSQYIPDSVLATQFLDALDNNYTQSFSLGVNKSWSMGDILGISNQEDYSFFIGPDQSFRWGGDSDNTDFGIGSFAYSYGTNENIFRAGLQVDSGFGLGSLELKGGVNSRLNYSPDFGITLSASPASASLELTYPYAYLNVAPEARIKFTPYIYASGSLFGVSGSTGNILDWINIDKTFDDWEPLVDLDTRDITGSAYSQAFSWGPFTTTARIPRFSESGNLDQIPSAFLSDRLWGTDSSGTGVAYGISGSASLFEFSASLGQLITDLFGIPLTASFNGGIGPIQASGSFTVADATIDASTDLDYEINAAYKDNFYVQVEGAGDLMSVWNPSNDLTLGNFDDLDDDGFIQVKIHSDPIIGVQAKVSLDSSLAASYSFLEASGSIGIPRIDTVPLGFGPIFDDSFSLGDIGNIELFDEVKMWRLSDLAPDIQSQLAIEISVPIV